MLRFIDHRLPSRAHELFGFSDSVLKWMQSYLSDRQHCVAVGGCRSTFVTNLTGVPHSSVLDPFLFSIFTTPVGNIIDSLGVIYHQYADDTQLYTTIKLSSSDMLASLSACADAVTSWQLENDLLSTQTKRRQS